MAFMLFRTSMGWICAASREGKLTACSPSRRANSEAVREAAAHDRPGEGDELLTALAHDVRRYFAGEMVDFEPYRVDLSGQPRFYRRAMLAAREIPYGEVRSYAWLAARAGNPRGARAAGQAMAHNPIGLVIPCHRVVGSDGSLTGFGGGLPMKRRLLELEGVRVDGGRVAL